MPVDIQVQKVLQKQSELGFPSLESATIEEIRQAFAYSRTQLVEIITPVASIVDTLIASPEGDIPIRIYTPEAVGVLPVMVFFHGGGFVLGDLETTDNICRFLAHHAGCIVVSVAYRLAPEHPFPSAVHDAYFATKWVSEKASSFHGDASRIAVGGESAGGNLAAVVSLLARDKSGPAINFQLLIYPAVSFSFDSPSCIECGNKYNLTLDEMIWFRSNYLANEELGALPAVSPMLAESLAELPPALVITAEFDPIRDDGEAYADRLNKFGTKAKKKRYAGMVHSFLNYSGSVEQSKIALEEIAAELRQVFQAKR
ncbi:alpha/beta hydrolase [Brevibacillus fluminis]|uniref:Alpha/beta hydrolase n=1 Tax=Brevibacillus fluminis TaxID=511487 RepID=A0A3M8CZT9_9BACL|nr:alpha/beta hydrolase [Brevibacillus fluminis]RNB81243.1 alpha/beta hydrolase [Brevibacillus fluminis]